MANKKLIIVFAVIIGVVIVGGLFIFFSQPEKELKLVPLQEKPKETVARVKGTEVGTGWSAKENPQEAIKEAIGMALAGKVNKAPDFAIIFASSGSDMETILSKAKEIFGNKTKIYGGSSDSRAVMTDKGFVKATEKGYEQALMEGKRGLVIMTITSKDIVFGIGSADFSVFPSVQEAAKSAILNAIKNAGKSANELPKATLVTITIGNEEEALEGITQVLGTNILLLGGTAGGPQCAVLGENSAHKKGISLAVIYTDLPIGWTFEGGFDVTDPHSGIATKVDGQDIVEIDNRPALDVYDEWLGGKIGRLFEEVKQPDLIRDLLALHPIYRKYTSSDGKNYFLFSHPWPKDETMKDRSVSTSTKIKEGEKIYLSHGTWETSINRIGNLPRNAKVEGGIDVNKKPLFGIGYICAGVLGTIPDTEREKLPILINYANNLAPFIATFTWGEQGYFPGVGIKHGNLLTSFLVIADKD